jgi:hypothetical protein
VRNRSVERLKRLISKPGSKLAYSHHVWSSLAPEATDEEFWSLQLSKIDWSSELEDNINAVRTYLQNQEKTRWLDEVLRFLPKGHVFNTVVYLNLGYDNIVFGENVALNLNSRQFGLDRVESVYYLIHELAHAGYLRYHSLPELWNVRTKRELLKVVKFLTHLEGMGVISALRIRIRENGLCDNDYAVFLNDAERARRVSRYFKLVSELEADSDEEVDEPRSRLFEEMSGKETRLWYITGCHMAREIGKRYGIEKLGDLVRQGSEEFFNTYWEVADRRV